MKKYARFGEYPDDRIAKIWFREYLLLNLILRVMRRRV